MRGRFYQLLWAELSDTNVNQYVLNSILCIAFVSCQMILKTLPLYKCFVFREQQQPQRMSNHCIPPAIVTERCRTANAN